MRPVSFLALLLIFFFPLPIKFPLFFFYVGGLEIRLFLVDDCLSRFLVERVFGLILYLYSTLMVAFSSYKLELDLDRSLFNPILIFDPYRYVDSLYSVPSAI